MKKTITLVILALVIVGSGLVIIRFFSGSEDAWICTNGEWVRHGHPLAPMPQEKCGQAADTNAAAEPPATSMIIPAEMDFFRNGELVRNRPDLATKGWYMVYSRLGLTPVTVRVVFNKDSDCQVGGQQTSCSDLGEGDVMTARIEGYQIDPETVLVRNLMTPFPPQ